MHEKFHLHYSLTTKYALSKLSYIKLRFIDIIIGRIYHIQSKYFKHVHFFIQAAQELEFSKFLLMTCALLIVTKDIQLLLISVFISWVITFHHRIFFLYTFNKFVDHLFLFSIPPIML